MNDITSPKNENTYSCTLYVCTSCRIKGTPREPREARQGFTLFQELKGLIQNSPMRNNINIQPAECLSVCPRPCGIALCSHGSWTYLFGDQQSQETAHDILKCVALYLRSPKGFMQRTSRPKSMQGSILGRIPPNEGEGICT